jgi:hypothetical protein
LGDLRTTVGRPFFDTNDELIIPEQRNGSGVDELIVTSSAAPPLRVLVAGLTRDLSVDTARRCAEFICSTVYDIIAWDTRGSGWDTKRLQGLYDDPPDVIMVVGGVDTGPVGPVSEMVRVLTATFSSLEKGQQPVNLFAGNQDARRPVATAIGGRLELRVVENVRPTLATESISEARLELQKLYRELKIDRLPGFDHLKRWSKDPALPTPVSFEAVLRLLSHQYDLEHGVLGLDVGSYSTQILMASEAGLLSFLQRGTGCGRGLRRVLDIAGLYELLLRVPIAMKPGEARTRLANIEMRPASISQTFQDLMLVQAVGREAASQTLAAARAKWKELGGHADGSLMPPLDMIVVRGGVFSHAPHPGQVALMALDALQPTGVTRLLLDWASMLPQLGALSRSLPLATTQVLQRDALMELGTIISPIGQAREGQLAVKAKLQRDDSTVVEFQVPAGSIRRVPLRAEQTGILELRPSHRFDIGLGRPGAGGKVKIHGGVLGLVIDARGRPLAVPSDNRERLLRMQQWLRTMQARNSERP